MWFRRYQAPNDSYLIKHIPDEINTLKLVIVEIGQTTCFFYYPVPDVYFLWGCSLNICPFLVGLNTINPPISVLKSDHQPKWGLSALKYAVLTVLDLEKCPFKIHGHVLEPTTMILSWLPNFSFCLLFIVCVDTFSIASHMW